MEELTPRQLLALHMHVGGSTGKEIGRTLGVAQVTVSGWKKLPAWLPQKQALLDRIEAEHIQKVSDLGVKLDGIASQAVDTLEALNRGADTDSVRLGAAKDILDRAPSAPKTARQLGGEGTQVVLQIGVQAVGNMKAALRDVGRGDVVNLLEEGQEEA